MTPTDDDSRRRKTQPSTFRSFVEIPAGTVHFARSGECGPAVLLLHQVPRSFDEFRDVLPLLGSAFRAFAMDTLGFGDSSAPPWPPTIERWAATAVSVLDVLGLDRVSVVGHHTGAAIGMEVAAGYPERVERLVLSAPPFVDDERRLNAEQDPPVDCVERRLDGSHLGELWSQRAPFYPDTIDLLERYLVDALKAGQLAAEGHRVVSRYEMQARLPLISAPTLVIAPTEDPFAYPVARKVATRIRECTVVDLPGAMVPAPDQMPEEFARLVAAFLEA
jgi:pimeloyl-ACP methyl ester carboxylesterase